jgi:hypothetical protein
LKQKWINEVAEKNERNEPSITYNERRNEMGWNEVGKN